MKFNPKIKTIVIRHTDSISVLNLHHLQYANCKGCRIILYYACGKLEQELPTSQEADEFLMKIVTLMNE